MTQSAHLNSDGTPKYTNHLANETSPYLRKHTHDPVEWYPWGAEALERARRENKPIHLSVGYTACHWCNVLHEESFEDEATARILNDNFVNIKVDREERPDIDRIYQIAQQMLTQRGGGWPLTMFLTHDGQRPFFGGTYFPKEARFGLPAFSDILLRVAAWYREHAGELGPQSDALLAAFAELNPPPAGADSELTAAPLETCRAHPAPHGRGRHQRSARRGFLPLRGGRVLDDPALRENAVRQRRAARRLRTGRARPRRCTVRARGARDRRLGAERDAVGAGRILLEPRRGLGGPRRQVLRVGSRGGPRGAQQRGVSRVRAALRARSAAELRGPLAPACGGPERGPRLAAGPHAAGGGGAHRQRACAAAHDTGHARAAGARREDHHLLERAHDPRHGDRRPRAGLRRARGLRHARARIRPRDAVARRAAAGHLHGRPRASQRLPGRLRVSGGCRTRAAAAALRERGTRLRAAAHGRGARAFFRPRGRLLFHLRRSREADSPAEDIRRR